MAAEAWVDMSIEIDSRANPSIWTNPTESEWTRIDVTNQMRKLAIRRKGARKPWTRPQPSELVLTLGNLNGYLDPSFATGPYVNLLTRRRQLRCVYTPRPQGTPTFVAVPSRRPAAGTANAAVNSFDLDVGSGLRDDLVVLVAVAKASAATDLTVPAPWVRVSVERHVAEDITLGIWTCPRRDIVDTTPTVTIVGGPAECAGACYVARPAEGRKVSLEFSTRAGSGSSSGTAWTANGVAPGRASTVGRKNLRLVVVANRPDGGAVNVTPDVGFTERVDTTTDWVGLELADRPWESLDAGTGTAWNGTLSAAARWITIQFAIIDEAKTFFHGLVERWPVRWTKGGFDATTVLMVFDRLRALGKQPSSLVEWELNRGVRYPRPLAYWPLRERIIGPDRQMTEAIGYTGGATIAGGPPKAAGAELVPYSDIEGVNIDNLLLTGGPIVHDLSAAFPFPAGSFTLAAVMRTRPGGSVYLSDQNGVLSGLHLGIRNNGTGTNVFRGSVGDGGSSGRIDIISTTAGDDNLAHLVALTNEDSGSNAPGATPTLRLYADLSFLGGVNYTSRDALWYPLYFGIGNGGAIALVMLWNQTLSHSTGTMALTRIYEDIFRPGQGDSMRTRIERILNIAAPGAHRNIETVGDYYLVPFNPMGRPTLDLLGNTVTDIQGGRMWVAIHDFTGEQFGKIRINLGKPRVLRTYGVGGIPVTDMAVEDQAVAYKSVKVSNEVGNEWTVGDPSDGEQLTISDSTIESGSLKNMAQYQLDASVAEAKPAVSSMTINPHRPEVGFDDTLALDLYDRVNAAYQRPWVAGPTTELREICDLDHDFDTTTGWLTTAYFRTPAA